MVFLLRISEIIVLLVPNLKGFLFLVCGGIHFFGYEDALFQVLECSKAMSIISLSYVLWLLIFGYSRN